MLFLSTVSFLASHVSLFCTLQYYFCLLTNNTSNDILDAPLLLADVLHSSLRTSRCREEKETTRLAKEQRKKTMSKKKNPPYVGTIASLQKQLDQVKRNSLLWHTLALGISNLPTIREAAVPFWTPSLLEYYNRCIFKPRNPESYTPLLP